ncbi:MULTISPECIES: flagellar biosynthetic protein FliQ [Rhodomicrobium]|uniref:EscS/YscS/HrcS family type III secretion system export apparatus protein n=1 Tax=Rhodomicrobium TaxID=1068 RepID=UPI000B4BA194|nr:MULTISPECIES: flagellar biosynthetic protein FliQ [Rhodomicrobium]
MFENALLGQVNNALMIVLWTSAPVLLAAVVIGVLVGLLQALTQIHDQTLPQAVKLIATLIIIMLLGPFFAQNIADQTSTVLNEFAVMTR